MQQTQPPPVDVDAKIALYDKGHYAGMECRARSLLELYPDADPVWQVFGISLHMQGKDSLSALQMPAYPLHDNAGVDNNPGNALHDFGQLDGVAAAGGGGLLPQGWRPDIPAGSIPFKEPDASRLSGNH